MKITHAYVRYEGDKHFAIVSIADIEDFSPKWEDDFSPTAYYSVRWTAPDGSCSDFYRARILILGESQQAVSRKASKRRVRFHLILDSDSSDDDSTPQKSPPKRKSLPNAATKEKLPSILERKKAAIASAGKASTEQQQNSELADLEESLKQKNSLLEQLQKERHDQKQELKDLQKANLALQEKLLRSLDTSAGDHSCDHSLAASSTENTAASPSSVDIMQDSLDMEQASPPHRIAPKTPTDDGALVDIGQGLLIKKKSWERIQTQEKDSIFVKQLMMAIWTKDRLTGRSLQGKHSPLYPGRPRKTALTPWKVGVMRECYKARLESQGYPKGAIAIACKQMNHFVVEKIADENRMAKRALRFSAGQDDAAQ